MNKDIQNIGVTDSKKIFISYSWVVKDRVIKLADRLIMDGVQVVIDVYDLKPGDDKYEFMERSVNDDSIDYALIICDRTYAEKANSREGGVGDETVIITPHVYKNNAESRFIPIVFEKNEDEAYLPTYLGSRIYIDLSDEEMWEKNYESLLRHICEKPVLRRPALGKMPTYLNDEKYDYSKLRKYLKKAEESEKPVVRRDFFDETFEILDQIFIEKINDAEKMLSSIDSTKDLKDFIADYCSIFISNDIDIHEEFTKFIENIDKKLRNRFNDIAYQDTIGFLIWELFLSYVAITIHYEKYSLLYNMISGTFFINGKYARSGIGNYTILYHHSKVLENYRENTGSKKLTLQGDILVERSHKSILTKNTLSEADLVLYQMSFIYGLDVKWYPITYIYHDGPIDMWTRLISKKHCEKLLELFEVKTIDELREKIISNTRDMNGFKYSYQHSCEQPISILDTIPSEKIGTMR